jgi:DNA-binding beta-propeller fold protein YncE
MQIRLASRKCLFAVGVLLALGSSTANTVFAADDSERERSFTAFESGQVRPLALSPSKRLLFATNTPDNRLEIYRTTPSGLRHCASVGVGLEPVAVAARSESEVWVVNLLSDSVSIVKLQPAICELPWIPPAARSLVAQVTRTLLVGDEPRDIVFAGPNRGRAFVTTAHRGQNVPYDPQLTTPGIGRADVWVFDANAPGDTLAGTPLSILTLFTDTPRALAVSPDGSRVYAAGFQTGNQTTTVHEQQVTANGGLPAPRTDAFGVPQPPTSLVVKFDGSHWLDDAGRSWDRFVNFSLPDTDVFAIDANATPPVEVEAYASVGTVLFNMIVNPRSGKVYVSNTDANNLSRFEGPGDFAGSTVRGHIVESRISVLDDHGVSARHLNKHIDYSTCCAPAPNAENARSLAFPLGLEITSDGRTLYVAGFGSSKVGVYSTSALENDTFVPNTANQIVVSGGGPTGLALDEARNRLYVLTRFNNSIAIIDTRSKHEVGGIAMYNPEPPSIVDGRRFLYDASLTSSHGDSACASCHIFGDFDSLAWDLGAPDGTTIPNPGPFTVSPMQIGLPQSPDFHALKGPMTTQSLRGMANHGPMHWRGDRTAGNSEPSVQPDSGAFNEDANFKLFNVAIAGLNGRDRVLDDDQMQAFTDFILQVTYPPNPVRALDNSLTPLQQQGRDTYFAAKANDTFFNCNGCHVLDPDGNRSFGVAKPGFFGSDGRYSFEFEAQVFKVPHLRNAYQKVGMFGMEKAPFFLPEDLTGQRDNADTGPQVRGFGFLHDGSTDTLFRFVQSVVFMQRGPGTLGPRDPGNPFGLPVSPAGFLQRRALEAFILAYDSNLAPIVGQQATLTASNAAAVGERIALLEARADAGECDLVAREAGRSLLYVGGGDFAPDFSFAWPIADAALRAAPGYGFGPVTYTCVPPGSGVRIALDRDLDGHFDGDELVAGSDPADPASVPWWAK